MSFISEDYPAELKVYDILVFATELIFCNNRKSNLKKAICYAFCRGSQGNANFQPTKSHHPLFYNIQYLDLKTSCIRKVTICGMNQLEAYLWTTQLPVCVELTSHTCIWQAHNGMPYRMRNCFKNRKKWSSCGDIHSVLAGFEGLLLERLYNGETK